MPVWLADAAGLQGEQHDASLLARENREIGFRGLGERAAVVGAWRLCPEMEQVRLRGDRLSRNARVAEACRVVGQGLLRTRAVGLRCSDDQPIYPRAGDGGSAGDTRSAQDLATVDRHRRSRPFTQFD